MNDFANKFLEITGAKHDEIGIYRGPQPEQESDWLFLKIIGVTQIIKLNTELLNYEKAQCAKLGMELFYSPIPASEQILTEPDLQSLRDVVGFIHAGTFIHCEHGEDRTGLVIGLFRVLKQGWSRHDAYKEMLKRGYHPILLGLDKAWHDLTKTIKP